MKRWCGVSIRNLLFKRKTHSHSGMTRSRATGGNPAIGRKSTKIGWVVAVVPVCITVIVYVEILRDEGLRRSCIFWGSAFPMYLHYRYVQWATKGQSEELISEEFSRLHRLYSPKVEKLTLKLRGFYLKQAQLMSTIDDFVPPEYMVWLKKMQDEVPSTFAPGEARKTVEQSLGKPIEEVFSYWNDIPRGVASIGEVHYAILKDGREVAVKIQFPNIETKFRSDLKTIRAFCKLAMPQHVPPLDEIEKQFLTEFNYFEEAENLKKVADNIMPHWHSRVVVPYPYLEMCSRTVLVMDYIHGVRLIDGIRNNFRKFATDMGTTLEKLEEEQKEKIRRGDLKDPFVEKYRLKFIAVGLRTRDYITNTFRFFYNYSLGLVLPNQEYHWSELPINLAEIIELLHEVHAHQLFIDGIFNGDPHPGNLLLTTDGRLGLVDFGQVKSIGLAARLKYAKLMIALSIDDKDKIVNIFTQQMGMRGKNQKPEVAYKIACFWNDRNTNDIMNGMNIPNFLDWAESEDPILEVNDDFVMVARVSVLLRGLGNAFGLQLRTSQYWRSYAQQLLTLHGEYV